MSTRPGWVPGCDLPWTTLNSGPSPFHEATYGGVVYSLAPAAVLKAVADAQGSPDATNPEMGLHVSFFPFSPTRFSNTLAIG